MIENTEQENEWQDCYERRQTKWKQNQTANDSSKSHLPTNDNIQSTTIETIQTRPLEIHKTLVPNIQSQTHVVDEFCDVNSDCVAQEWSLNDEQTRAFKIIAEHSQTNNPEPLRMFIGGPAGTGKSRVINALKDFFHQTKSNTMIQTCLIHGSSCMEHLRHDSTCFIVTKPKTYISCKYQNKTRSLCDVGRN